MKTLLQAGVLALMSLFGLSGCGRDSAPSGSTSSPVVVQTIIPGTASAPREVKVEVGDAMKFSLDLIEARPGETLRLLLVNTGSAPVEAMGHNWVLLRAGVDSAAFVNDAVNAKATGYFPTGRASGVIAHSKLLGGKSRDMVEFIVPSEPGDYVYLCTFPAHFQLGMKGVLAVRQGSVAAP